MSGHLSELTLDALRIEALDDARAAEARHHIEGCERCRVRAEALKDEAARFRERHDPGRLATETLARVPEKRPLFSFLRWTLAPVAAAVLFAVVAVPRERAKGGAGVELYAVEGGEPARVDRVKPGATVRVRFDPGGPAFARLWWIDERGEKLAIFEGAVEASTWVERELHLDRSREPEAVLAVFCPAPFEASAIPEGCTTLRREVLKE